MNFRKNSKGITLIALVITIIVLLILAGVSLSLIMGNDGILGRAENAVTEHTNASIEEEIQLAIGDLTMEYYENEVFNTGTELDSYIQNRLEEGYETASGETITLVDGKLDYKGKKVNFNLSDGKVEVDDEESSAGGNQVVIPTGMYSVAGITADDIADVDLFDITPIDTPNGEKLARIKLKSDVVKPTEDNYYNIDFEGDTFVVPYQVEFEGEMYEVAEVDLITIGKHLDSSASTVYGRECPSNFPGVKALIYPNTVLKMISTEVGSPSFGYTEEVPLESVVLSNQLEEIPSEMFWCARKLTSITIPSSVTSIERDAFEGCSDLRTINYTGSQEDWEKITIHER